MNPSLCRWRCLSLGLLLLSSIAPPLAAKSIVGWVERVEFLPQKLSLKAKMDTGARTSSLNYHKVDYYEKEGKQFARVEVWNDRGEQLVFDAPVTRVSSVKEQFGKIDERNTVELTFCLGQVVKKVEVNLADRKGFNYQLLVGRNFLAGDFLVDPNETFLTKPACKGP